MPEPLAPETSRCCPASTSMRATRSRPSTSRSTHLHDATHGSGAGQVGPQGQGRARLAHLVALGDLEPPVRIALAAGERALHVRALEPVDELVVVARRPVVGDGRGLDPARVAQPGQLVLLGGVGLLPPPSRGRTVLLVRRPAAAEPAPAVAVGAERDRVEVEQVGAHVVEQHPVVAGEHHDPRQVSEERGQVADSLVVEVVGRLVEQEARRPGGHHRGQREPGALAARQRADEALGGDAPETEPLGRLRRTPVGVPGVVGDREVERRGVRRLARLVGEVPREPLDVGDHPAQRGQGPGEHRADRGVVAERRLLAEHHQIVGGLDQPGHGGAGRQGAGHGAQQRRLAGPVLADEAGAPSRRDGQVEVVQHSPGAERDVERADPEGGEGGGRRHAGALRRKEGDSPGGAAGASRVSRGSTWCDHSSRAHVILTTDFQATSPGGILARWRWVWLCVAS